MDRWKWTALGILLVSIISIVNANEFQILDITANKITAFFNSTGSLNLTEGFTCENCIQPGDVDDIDDEDIETDLNTYVDIAGDTMTANLGMGGKNITETQMLNITDENKANPICIYNNGTHIIIESC